MGTLQGALHLCGRTEIASESCFASGVDHFLSLSMELVVKFLSPSCARRSGAARIERIAYMVVGVGVGEVDRGRGPSSFLLSLILATHPRGRFVNG